MAQRHPEKTFAVFDFMKKCNIHPYQLFALSHMQTWQLEEMTNQRNKLVQNG